MPKTTKLQLPIVTDDNTLFETWRKSINGNLVDSAFKIIDDFAVEIYGILEGGVGEEYETMTQLDIDNKDTEPKVITGELLKDNLKSYDVMEQIDIDGEDDTPKVITGELLKANLGIGGVVIIDLGTFDSEDDYLIDLGGFV